MLIIIDRRDTNRIPIATPHSPQRTLCIFSIHPITPGMPPLIDCRIICCMNRCAMAFNSRSIQSCARDRRPLQRIRCFRGAECSSVIIEASEEQLNINLNSDRRANSAMVQNLTFSWLPGTTHSFAPRSSCHFIQWPPLLVICRRRRRLDPVHFLPVVSIIPVHLHVRPLSEVEKFQNFSFSLWGTKQKQQIGKV